MTHTDKHTHAEGPTWFDRTPPTSLAAVKQSSVEPRPTRSLPTSLSTTSEPPSDPRRSPQPSRPRHVRSRPDSSEKEREGGSIRRARILDVGADGEPSARTEGDITRSFDFEKFAASRRSWLGFEPAPIERDLIRQLVATASTAPSELNSQPWHFVVVESPAFNRLTDAIWPRNRPKLVGAAAVAGRFCWVAIGIKPSQPPTGGGWSPIRASRNHSKQVMPPNPLTHQPCGRCAGGEFLI
jgi:Nitroreductase family